MRKQCACGCGQLAAPGKRFIAFHAARGSNNPRYQGGIYFNSEKQRWVIICRDGSREYYARAVMEAQIKRVLQPGEVVHHIDSNTTNDSPENLRIMDWLDHNLLSGTKYTAEDLLEYLRKYYRQLGRPPRNQDFIGDPKQWPHPSTYRRVFGSWNKALLLAGVPLVRATRRLAS